MAHAHIQLGDTEVALDYFDDALDLAEDFEWDTSTWQTEFSQLKQQGKML